MKALFRIAQSTVQLSTERPVRVQRLDVTRAVAAHDHDYHEICLIVAGRAGHRTRAGREVVSAGDAIVMPPGAVHSFEQPNGLQVINVYYLAEWISVDPALLWGEAGVVPLFCSQALVRLPAFGAKRFRLDDTDRALAARELAEMETELARAAPGPALLKGCFLKLITRMARAWHAQDAAAEAATFRPEVWQAMRRIERCVSGGQPFSLARLARHVGLSADHLSAEFRAVIGYSPVQYFQRRRVQRACQMLADPRLSVTEIAQTLGYADAPHFCRHFRAQQKLSPRTYRATFVARDAPGAAGRMRSAGEDDVARDNFR